MLKFEKEVRSIQDLRTKYASRPALSLARQIASVNFADPADRRVAHDAIGEYSRCGASRSVLSVYSVIRRFDKSEARRAEFSRPSFAQEELAGV